MIPNMKIYPPATDQEIRLMQERWELYQDYVTIGSLIERIRILKQHIASSEYAEIGRSIMADEQRRKLESLMLDIPIPTQHAIKDFVYAALASTRDQAVRECAEIAMAMPKLRQLSPDHVAANTPQDVALAILSLSQVSAKK